MNRADSLSISSAAEVERLEAKVQEQALQILSQEGELISISAAHRWLLSWLTKQGLLHAQFCKPPGAPVGNYWVLHSPATIDGGSCDGFGKTEEDAVDAAMTADQGWNDPGRLVPDRNAWHLSRRGRLPDEASGCEGE